MAHKFCFEALGRTLNDIMRKENKSKPVFGGKVIVFGGDFRKILPVIPRGNISYLFMQQLVLPIFGTNVRY